MAVTLRYLGNIYPYDLQLFLSPPSSQETQDAPVELLALDKSKENHQKFYQVYVPEAPGDTEYTTCVIATYDLQFVLEAGVGTGQQFHYRKAPGPLAEGEPLPEGITDNMKFYITRNCSTGTFTFVSIGQSGGSDCINDIMVMQHKIIRQSVFVSYIAAVTNPISDTPTEEQMFNTTGNPPVS